MADDKRVDMVGLIDHLEYILAKRFSRVVSKIYFGDIGVYLPESFGGSRKEQKAIVAIQPEYNRLLEGTRTVAGEYRNLGVGIIVLVNITPFFKANPEEAYGERMLVQITTEIAQFLTQESNVELQDRVQFSEVGDIDWAWMRKGDQSVRAARIEFTARVRVDRLQE